MTSISCISSRVGTAMPSVRSTSLSSLRRRRDEVDPDRAVGKSPARTRPALRSSVGAARNVDRQHGLPAARATRNRMAARAHVQPARSRVNRSSRLGKRDRAICSASCSMRARASRTAGCTAYGQGSAAVRLADPRRGGPSPETRVGRPIRPPTSAKSSGARRAPRPAPAGFLPVASGIAAPRPTAEMPILR